MQEIPDKPKVLEYGKTRGRSVSFAVRLLIYLMPLWCALIITAAFVPRRKHDDEYWAAAAILAFTASVGCVVWRWWLLAAYCAVVGLLVCAVMKHIIWLPI
jgi:uncharacterized membrane protein YhaH (DUF805 family)